MQWAAFGIVALIWSSAHFWRGFAREIERQACANYCRRWADVPPQLREWRRAAWGDPPMDLMRCNCAGGGA